MKQLTLITAPRLLRCIVSACWPVQQDRAAQHHALGFQLLLLLPHQRPPRAAAQQ
jgi:hypothetical protein